MMYTFKNVVKVKYGKPIIQLTYRSVRIISFITAILNVLIMIYVFELFNAAIEIRTRLTDFISLLEVTIYGLPTLLSLSALLTFPINLIIIITTFKVFSSKKAVWGYMLFSELIMTGIVLLLLIALIGLALFYGYKTDPTYFDDFLHAMSNYSTDGNTKKTIDRLQVEFQCCGSRNYSDWYYVEWYDSNFIKKTKKEVIGETPFSCCSIRSTYPCIHHGIEEGAGPYYYTNDANFSLSVAGCVSVVEEKKVKTSWTVVGYISALFLMVIVSAIPLRLVQTAHVDRGKFDKESHIYTAWLIGCYQGRERVFDTPPVPPFPPELME